MSLNELLKERADLIARLEVVNAAIAAASKPATAHEIRTWRNLRNTGRPAGVEYFADAALTKRADPSWHEAYVSGESLAALRAAGYIGNGVDLVD